MTTFLIVYFLSAILILYASVLKPKTPNYKTISVEKICITVLMTLLPVVNTVVAVMVIVKLIQIVDEYDKELKNPFYKKNDKETPQ